MRLTPYSVRQLHGFISNHAVQQQCYCTRPILPSLSSTINLHNKRLECYSLVPQMSPLPIHRQSLIPASSSWRGYSVRERRTRRWAYHIVDQLSEEEREILYEEIMKIRQTSSTDQTALPLDRSVLRLIAFAHGLPFIGFGFLDNAIMIIAGEYIDFTLGTLLGFSTMAAAGLGNLVSDLVGIGSVGYVEIFAARIGVAVPHLTAEQLHQKSARWASFVGRSLGITLGCLLGMLPLLFFKREPRRKLDEKETQTEAPSNDK